MAGLCFHLARIGQPGQQEKVETGQGGAPTGLAQLEDGDVHGNIFILSGEAVSFIIGQGREEVIQRDRETQVFYHGEIPYNDHLAQMFVEIILDVISDNNRVNVETKIYLDYVYLISIFRFFQCAKCVKLLSLVRMTGLVAPCCSNVCLRNQ